MVKAVLPTPPSPRTTIFALEATMSTTALDNERWGAGERNGASPGGQLALGQVRPDWERLEVARRSERKAAAAASQPSLDA